MKKVGEITYIADSKFAIAKTTEFLILGSEVLVCAEIKLDGEMNAFRIPKGKLKVVMLQDENIYLLSVVTKNNAEDTHDNQTLIRSLSIFSSLFPKNAGTTEVPASGDTDLAEYSAKLDAANKADIKINPKVQENDSIYF
jgi:hypothetical protein